MTPKNPIRFSPYANNVLDYIGTPLEDAAGVPILILRSNMDFVVYVNGIEQFRSKSNIEVSYYLNQRETHVK